MPFRDIQGHRRLLELLARSIARDSLPPSLIFAGPASAGTRATATAVAQALNCLHPRDGDACGTCHACARIARGVHPDVHVVEPAETGVIRIDPVREVIESAAYRPFEGRRRVAIVDGADLLMPQAQNALLKTLEEPPPGSVFILVTARPDMLLPTVRSRCIRLQFAEGAAETIDEEALEIAKQVLGIAAVSTDAERRLDGAKYLLVNTGGSATAAEDRAEVALHLRAVASLLRDLEILATRADAGGLANPDVRPVLERLTPAYGGERGVRAFTAVDQALVALERNAGVKVVADWVMLQL